MAIAETYGPGSGLQVIQLKRVSHCRHHNVLLKSLVFLSPKLPGLFLWLVDMLPNKRDNLTRCYFILYRASPIWMALRRIFLLF
jgi:hypothetical protein